ncbi:MULTISPECIES: PilC/PilY family type IV pilus protein [unclassified Pseudomonas]|uniref:pilus assembly protein n=1 Tax=unclassified Pseudomonas TaxID=196821 RepID=UPI000D38FA3D|nr:MULTISPECIES: PilC/PilY family type IV pilus protein [unclassified Pseudomonas]RAU44906.1 pilus assembly protein PilY [Pseudomonas sp. RIT 409]RAU53522.1 pilus assembly protein PilY [Pseudomonas sp. RIT 412]
MKKPNTLSRFIVALVCLLPLAVAHAAVSQVPAQLPLFVNNSVPPLNMLVVGRDHKLFFPAYNDASDLDGDGSIDLRYKPSITYLGYFDSNTCYSYGSGFFSATATATNKKCSGRWSGDYLNYLTTSRADALRKVLYGGYRSTDTTDSTILERAYIPTDAHTWGKEYTSFDIDGYNLSDYTPYANPTTGRRTLFANNTQSTLNGPLLRVLPNIANVRIFGWVSRESVQGGSTATTTSFSNVVVNPDDYVVRVQACKTGFLESNCKLYPNGKYKPTGILHDFGEGNQMYFGLMTGTYQNNLQGGVIRKAISSFANEINASTGVFITRDSAGNRTGIIGNLDGLTITNTGCSSQGNSITNGSCQSWGNPLAEMMFETLRYFSGETSPTSSYAAGLGDTALGLTSLATWTNPYSATPDANANAPTYPSCSKPFQTLFSDVNPSYDSDLPGSAYNTAAAPSVPTALSNFNAQTQGQVIWNNDVGAGSRNINIGQTPSASDTAPTAKVASSLGNIRGLPEEATKQGTFNAGSVAYFGNTRPITSLGSQKVQTFSIALSSTLPRIQMPVGNGTITLLPFGKVTNNDTNEQLTGFYIDSMYNMPGQPTDSTVNGGRPQAIFRVVYDDSGQGGDYDMDAIVLYTVSVIGSGSTATLSVTSETVYSVAGYESHMGYTISGTTADGIYLEVTGGGNGNTRYSFDTPGSQLPGSCSGVTCPLLPGMRSGSIVVNGGASHTRTFSPSSTRSVTNLNDPLWYAAKWGGFGDANNISTSLPVDGQWDSNDSGTPNNYFLVSNASTLKDQLSAAFNQILQTNSSVATPTVLPALGTTSSSSTYLNSLNVATWSGDLIKTTTTYTSTNPTGTTVQNWSASAQMPTWSTRNIQIATQAGNALQPFTYSNLGNRTYSGVALQTTLTSDQVDFIKGDTSKATSTFRRRASLIGDLVNSSPSVAEGALYDPTTADTLNGTPGTYAAYQSTQSGRRGQIYVGANDGMLHGFDSTTGVEKFAFIPSAVISNLSVLTNKDYNSNSSLHRYYVDSTPVIADVYFSGAWHTILVGTLGAGGREVFALDITNPDSITLLWEFTSQNDVDLGSSFSIPVISKLHSGEWGVIFGNGYNGNNGNASLFVLNAATGAQIAKLTTSVVGNNGLSSPVVLDANADGIADYVYAGDLLGNLWRFDLINPGSLTSTTSASNYKVAFGNKPLYTATVSDTAGSAVQSITAAPIVLTHPTATGTLVIFGTGRYFTSADKTTTDLQTLYGIWDKQTAAQTAGSTPVLARSSLQQQTITSQVNNASFGTSSSDIRLVSTNTVDWNTKSGWYLNLAAGTSLLGERLVDPMTLSGSVLFASTRIPSTDVCSPGVTGWRYGLDPYTGGRTTFTVFNLRRNGTISTADNYNDNIVSALSINGVGTTLSSTAGLKTATSSTGDSIVVNTGTGFVGRQTWRSIPYP